MITFDVESAPVLVPAFEADLVAEDGEEALELLAAPFCANRNRISF